MITFYSKFRIFKFFQGRLKDPFPPARISAINALAATQEFYTVAETSGRVVPILCPLMSDPEKPVREQAFKVSLIFVLLSICTVVLDKMSFCFQRNDFYCYSSFFASSFFDTTVPLFF